MRILLVENHAAFASVVTQQFLHAHEVKTVATMSEARTQLAASAFDALLVDYDLDDGKGDTLVRELRGLGFAGKVIGISSHDAGNRALVAAGADAACPKARFQQIGGMLEA